MNRIEINFTECTPAPPQGYAVRYRVKGSPTTLTSAGTFYSSPAVFFDSSNPDGTAYEGFISSVFPGLTCNQIPWESGGSSGSSSGGGVPLITLTFKVGDFALSASMVAELSQPVDVDVEISNMYAFGYSSYDCTGVPIATTQAQNETIPAGGWSVNGSFMPTGDWSLTNSFSVYVAEINVAGGYSGLVFPGDVIQMGSYSVTIVFAGC